MKRGGLSGGGTTVDLEADIDTSTGRKRWAVAAAKSHYVILGLSSAACCCIFFPFILPHPWQFEIAKFAQGRLGMPAYRSQAGQDRYVLKRFFNGLTSQVNGTFVEFGARNGLDHSNTAYFEQELGWRGILVEPGPEFESIARNRPRSIAVKGAVCNRAGDRTFLETDRPGWHGFKDTYDPLRLQQLIHWNHIVSNVTLHCHLLQDLLRQHGMVHVNFMSVDTEGDELDFLQTFPFHQFVVDVVMVETLRGESRSDTKGQQVIAAMREKGYELDLAYGVSLTTFDLIFYKKHAYMTPP
mmetsp:Transcript_12380/g.19604  ORF Transcript_12380/g.19604 Transcript_12380/m.19604 type:complete len:298 (+) Transcript_12380:128-1021(+)